MRKLITFLALFASAPVLAMSAPPRVESGNTPVPLSELRALEAVQACVVRNYDLLPQTIEARRGVSAQVDYVTSQTERARQAQQVNNAAVFSEARANVVNTVRALGYPC